MNALRKFAWHGIGLVIVAAACWYFLRVFQKADVDFSDIHWLWLVASGFCYLISQAASAVYWYWLLRRMQQGPQLLPTFRAYFVGQLARYLPPRIWGLVLRSILLEGAGVRRSVASMAAVYDVLCTLCSAGIIASAVGIGIQFMGQQPMHVGRLLWFLIPLIVLFPPVFNQILNRMIRSVDHSSHRIRVSASSLMLGLTMAGAGWMIQGVGLLSAAYSLGPEIGAPLWATLVSCAAAAGGFVAGFFILPAPSGLGVREWVTQQTLVANLDWPLGVTDVAVIAAAAAILYRLASVAAEILAGLITFWLPGQPPATDGTQQEKCTEEAEA